MTTGRIIETDADVAEGLGWLCAQDTRWGQVSEACAPLPLRRRPDGFAQLLSAIVSQQVSTASAAAIWGRMEGAGLTDEAAVLAALGRADVFAPGDLALQIAAQDLFDLPERPKEKDLRILSEEWSPWRAVAARALFAYYRVVKGREGVRT